MRPLMLALVLAGMLACGGQTDSAPPPPTAPGDEGDYGGEIPLVQLPAADDASPPSSNPPPAPAPDPAGETPPFDGGDTPAGPPFDAGPDGVCPAPPGPGDLLVDELMIESVAGTGDYGEWLEVRSTLGCALDLRGLHGECPHTARVATFDVGEDVWIPAGGTFVVADSTSAALDHDLPEPLLAWTGQPGDVLRNKGTTVTLRMGDAIVDALTYPALTLTVGTSLAFPDDCAPATRSDWSRWQPSTASWFPGFLGTPNARNTDVHCP
jgi:hypothetical protein